jgi:hypothetical protein
MGNLSLALLLACPSCPPVIEARRLVFSAWFWSNLWIAVLPFLVTLVVVRWFAGRLDREVGHESRD